MGNLARQDFAYEPEHLIAGTTFPIMTAAKEAKTLLHEIKRGMPVKLTKDGGIERFEKADLKSAEKDGLCLYGIAAEDAMDMSTDKKTAIPVYLTGEFFADGLVLEGGLTAAELEVPFRKIGIFLVGVKEEVKE